MTTDKFTHETNEVMVEAFKLAESAGHAEITLLHLAASLISDPKGILSQAVVNAGGNDDACHSVGTVFNQALKKLPNQALKKRSFPRDEILVSAELQNMINKAHGAKGVTRLAVYQLISWLLKNTQIVKLLKKAGIAIARVKSEVEKVESATRDTNFQALKACGRDLVEDAGKFDPVISRDEEICMLMSILLKRDKNNPVLIGEPGVGKTAVVEGLAHKIVRGDVPRALADVRLIALDLGVLVAGSECSRVLEERLNAFMKEAKEVKEKVILFIDEIHNVFVDGRIEGSMHAANLFKPMLAGGQLRCIGATTREQYRKYLEYDAAFRKSFVKVDVAEPSVHDTIIILHGLKETYEGYHGVRILDRALVDAAELSNRYIIGEHLPHKAIDLVDEACVNVKFQLGSRPEEIDNLERRRMQLEVELHASEKEKDEASKARLVEVQKELEDLRNKLQPLLMNYRKEKGCINEIQQLKQKLGEIKIASVEAERRYVFAADLQHRENSKAFLVKAGKELDDLTNKLLLLLKSTKEERIDEIQGLKQEIEKLQIALQESDGRFYITKAAGLQCGVIQVLESTIAELEGSMDEKLMLTKAVGPEHIAEVVSRRTGIPVTRLSQTEKEWLRGLEDRLHERIVGQDQAVSAVAAAVLNRRVGYGQLQQPIGSFLFLGPTGVGKTGLAKALAEQFSDDEKLLVTIDMSEYMEQHSTSRLIGAPPGYVGHDAGGQLTEAVRERPYSVVLFDEVEKAHVSVFNILLQVLGDGRLTDGQGRTVDFRNTVIIMTSNLGSEHLLSGSMGNCTMQVARDRVMHEVKGHFRPEFLNRIDQIVVFDPLSRDQLKKVARLQIKDVAARSAEMGIALVVSDAALEYVLQESYDGEYGARPIKRWLQKKMVTALATMRVREEIDENSTVSIDARPNESGLVYTVVKNGGLVNAATGQKTDVLIQLPNGPKRSDAARAVKKRRTYE